MMNFYETLQSSAVDSLDQLLLLLPKLAIALTVFLLGWIFASVARKVSSVGLKWVKMENIAERAGIEQFLLKGGVRYTTSTIISNMVFWILLTFATLTALKFSGISDGTNLIQILYSFIPRLIVSLIVLLFGLVFASFIRISFLAWLNNARIAKADTIAGVAYFTMIVLIISVALERLGIFGNIIVYTFLLAFGALSLAMGIAFGLGARRHAKQILDKLLGKIE